MRLDEGGEEKTLAPEIVDKWEQHEGDMSMPEYAVGYNRGWDEGTKQARAEVLAACMAALEKSRAFQQRQASAAQDRGDRELVSSHERLEYCFAVALTVLRNVQPAAADLEALLREEREKYLEALCASVCSFCADGEKFDLHGDKQGYWCHTEKGVSPTWENQRCVAMSFRNVSQRLEKARAEGKG